MMGHAKLHTVDNVLTVSFPQSPKQDDGLASTEDLAAARIAERFAPNIRPAPAREARKADPRPEPVSTRKLRALIAVLVVVALLPSLVIGAVHLLGPIGAYLPVTLNFGAEARPSSHSVSGPNAPLGTRASLAGLPLPAGHRSKPTTALHVALGAPVILEGSAGEEVSFVLALSQTDALPTRSVIAIEGLPQGAALSAGRPHGEGRWYVTPEEIAGLRLALPDDARGDATLKVSLLTPGGEDIASAKTHLSVTHLSVTAEPVAPEAVAAHSPDGQQPNREIRAEDVAPQEISSQEISSQGVRPFVTEAVDSFGLVLDGDTIVAAPSPAEPPQAKAAERSQGPKTAGPKTALPKAALPKTAAPKAVTTKTDTAAADNRETIKQEPSVPAARAEGVTQVPAPTADEGTRITLSEFVNLRAGPSSSRRVKDVLKKGSQVRIIGSRRGWLKVNDEATSQTGWIYSRYASSARKTRYAMQGGASPSRLGSSGSEQDGSFWTRLERWVVGP